MKSNFFSLVVMLCIILLSANLLASTNARSENMEGPRLSDQEFFEMLNLDYPGLEKVKQAVSNSEIDEAKSKFVKHIKDRENPKWHFDWHARPENPSTSGFDTTTVDRYARNELVSVGVWHDFGGEIDWSINPMENKYREWTWQLSRHHFWRAMGRAYWKTGDEKYAKAFVFQMNSWVKQNLVPIDNAGNNTGSRWRTIETGIRTGQTWFPSFYYFLSSPSFDDESVLIMLKSFVEHAHHLMRWPQTGNWLTMEANGLFHIGVMLPEFKEAEQWRETAIDRLYKELDNQVYPDGAQIELSSGYHQVSLRNFTMPIKLAELNKIEVPGNYIAKLEKMCHYNLYAAMPNGQLPALNDGGWTNIRGYCREGFGYFPDRTDMQWMATDGKKGTRPKYDSYAFPYAGHFVMRSGWDKSDRYMLFDAGPFGYGHQHEDKLHFVLYAHGRVHVTDPGNYPYDSSQWRKYHISAFAHNTILVDGMPQKRRGFNRKLYVAKEPMDQNWYSGDDYDYIYGVFNEDPKKAEGVIEGYGPKRIQSVTHKREIIFVKPDYWIMLDTLTPHDEAEHSYESPFHLDAEAVEIDRDSKAVITKNMDTGNLMIIPAMVPGLDVEVMLGQIEPYVQGWVREGNYGVRPIPTPTYTLKKKGTAYFAYVFYPTPKSEKSPVESVVLRNANSDEKIEVDVIFSNGEKHIWRTDRKESALCND